jgi:hypothetical protein
VAAIRIAIFWRERDQFACHGGDQMYLRAHDSPFDAHGLSIDPSPILKGFLKRSNRYRPKLLLISRIQYANERYFSFLLRLSERGFVR